MRWSAEILRLQRVLIADTRSNGWNAAYIGPPEWQHKSQVLDQWCETERRDPKTILRTVNLGFYLGADAKAAARAEAVFRGHWGDNADCVDRTGYLRGTVAEARAMVDQFRALDCTRLCIALREGPYDWEALEAFAAEIVRASEVRHSRPSGHRQVSPAEFCPAHQRKARSSDTRNWMPATVNRLRRSSLVMNRSTAAWAAHAS